MIPKGIRKININQPVFPISWSLLTLKGRPTNIVIIKKSILIIIVIVLFSIIIKLIATTISIDKRNK